MQAMGPGTVEMLEGQADRIAVGMTGGAGGCRGVGQKPLPHRLERPVGIVDDGEVDIGGRQGRRLAQEDIHEGHAALGRRGPAGMGKHR